MKDQKSEDWLSTGGDVEVKERSHGGRDKFNQRSNLNEISKDGQINGENQTFPGQTSDQSEVTDTGSLKDGDSTKREHVSVPAGGGLRDKQCLESGLTKRGTKKTKLSLGKSKIKKELNLPRRASKRIAELKTSIGAHGVAIIQSGEGVYSTRGGSSSGSSASSVYQQPDYFEVEPEKHVQNVEAVINGDEKQRRPEEHGGRLKIHEKAEEKPGLEPDLPLGDFWTDPCIAFAIQTLTGMDFDDSRSNSVHSSGDVATTKDHFGNTEIDNMSSKKQKTSVDLPLGNLFRPEEHGGNVGSGDKSVSEAELPFEGSWADPCIEFAIKTLTGAIPLDSDSYIEEYFQQQLSSSRSQGNSSDLTLQNVGLGNFCQTDVLCQQLCEKEDIPVFKKQAYSVPAHTASASSESSAGSEDLNQKGRGGQQQSM